MVTWESQPSPSGSKQSGVCRLAGSLQCNSRLSPGGVSASAEQLKDTVPDVVCGPDRGTKGPGLCFHS